MAKCEISNSEDILDSRDIIERIADLETIVATLDECADFDESTVEELRILKALAEEAEQYAPDWKYGASLIRNTYFTEYCEDLVKDTDGLPRDIPSYLVIDWEKTANNLRVDYTEVDFDGVIYLIR